MPQIITTDLTASTAYTVQTTAADDFIFVAEGTLVSNTSPSSPAYAAIGVFHDYNRVGVAGTLFTGASPTVYSTAIGTTVSVTQTGSIISLAATSFWPTVQFSAGGAQVFNDGQITGLYGAILSSEGNAAVYNTGLISGVTFGIQGATRVENSGTIRGATSVWMGGFNDLVLNTGTLFGHVRLGLGSDTFDTIGGTIVGSVFDDGGDDLYRTDSAILSIVELLTGGTDRVESTVDFDLSTALNVENLTLLGNAMIGAGNTLGNILTGNFRDNTLGGGGGDDTVDGGTGNDSLRGDTGNDSVLGGDGDDLLRGGAGADTVSGGDGDDTIWGDVSNDRLYGDNGEDVLVGGAGRDSLYGGADSDTFVFRAIADSGVGVLRDIIVGFETGLDLIDLTRIDASTLVTGNQAFAYIGTGAFTSVAGQVRAIHGANSVIQADVNGDGVADFELQLNLIATVNVNDILL